MPVGFLFHLLRLSHVCELKIMMVAKRTVMTAMTGWALLAVLLRLANAASLSYNGLAQTPQMGWVRCTALLT